MLTLGDTDKSQAELENYLRSINHQYTQATYDLINHNCNNFSNNVSQFLLGPGRGIPAHIVDLPRIVFSTPGGMMLRPMIESMQSGISQNGGGMDPFGSGGGANPLAALSSVNSSVVGGNVSTTSATTVTPLPATASHPAAQLATTTTVRTFSPTPEEKAFVSAEVDANTLRVLCKKIINYSGASVEPRQVLLSQEEGAGLSAAIEALAANSLSAFPHETFALLGHLVQSVPALQMSSLFIMRLLALHLHQRDATCSRGSPAYAACQRAAQSLLGMVQAADSGGFSSPAALVMALCTLANLLSSQDGCDLLFRHADDEPANAAEARVGACVDACSWGLSHCKAEVRQMAATLAYNLALASTRGQHLHGTQSIVITQDVTSLPWRSLHAPTVDLQAEQMEGQMEEEGGGGELHQHIVQILCAVLETVGDETDAVSLGRKLHAAYYVCVAGGAPAVELVAALGFDEHLRSARAKPHLLTPADRQRLGNFELLLQNDGA